MFNSCLLPSFCNFNSLQILFDGFFEILFEKKPSLRKKFWSIYREALSVMWSNFTLVKYNYKISNIYHQIKFWKIIMNRSSIKKLLLKILQYSHKNSCVGVSLETFSPETLLKWLQHRCFPVNIAKILRTLVLKNICERLFERFATWANNITNNIGSEEDIFSKTKQKTILKLS